MSENWSEEDKNWAKEVLTCRQIVSEIVKFGISENQRIKIIELLALEIENREDSVTLARTAREILERKETCAESKGRILT